LAKKRYKQAGYEEPVDLPTELTMLLGDKYEILRVVHGKLAELVLKEGQDLTPEEKDKIEALIKGKLIEIT